MDWTYSPFIAMHFATAKTDRFSSDAAIWAVHVGDALSLAPHGFTQAWQKVGGYGLDLDTLPKLVPTLKDFEALSTEPFVVFFEPPSISDRIINQYAIFSAMSDPTIGIDDWLRSTRVSDRVRHKKIVIPATLKWEIRDKLDHANITERMLFPGLDGLCSWLRRYYGPKSSGAAPSGRKQ
jgi:hypothetical protein